MCGDHDSARERLQRSLEIRRELGERAGIASDLQQLGALDQVRGDCDSARERYQRSLEIRQQLGDRAGVAESLARLGLVAGSRGGPGGAVASLARAFVLFDELEDPRRDQVCCDLAHLRWEMGGLLFLSALEESAAAGDSRSIPALTRERIDGLMHATRDRGSRRFETAQILMRSAWRRLRARMGHVPRS